MPEPTLEEAVEQCWEALLSLREAERDRGWQLAWRYLGVLGDLLDDPPESDTKSDPRD